MIHFPLALLKRWLSQELTTRLQLRVHEPWWADCGSVKWVWTTDYYDRLFVYVDGQRMSGPTRLPRK